MQPLQICIGPIIRIGRESWCLPYAGFFLKFLKNLDGDIFVLITKKIKIIFKRGENFIGCNVCITTY